MSNSVVNITDFKVLMAEDDPINQELVKFIFEDLNWAIDVVSDGKQALGHLQSSQYDLILMDLRMPVMDGLEATKRIRTDFEEPKKSIPVIGVTAHHYNDEVQECLDAGMSDYITKPFNVSDFVSKSADLVLVYRKKIEGMKDVATGVSQTKEAEENLVNFDNLYTIAGNNIKTIETIIQLFMSQTPARLEMLEELRKVGDWQELKNLCHKMRSTYAIVGAIKIKNMLAEIENDCNNGNFDSDKFKILIGDIRHLSAKVITALNSLPVN
ncbi:MAG: response regulator [Cyclobacteriaceae bacterium]|nr:response regulator [Cyclobacteriaceae bacterium]